MLDGIKKLFGSSKKNEEPVKKAKKNTYVRIVAERNNWEYEEALERMKAAKAEYGFSYLTYAKEKMESMTPKQLEKKLETQNKVKENNFKKLLEVTGWSEEYAKEECDRIKAKYGIGINSYYKGQYYLLSDEAIEERLATKKQKDEERIQRLLEKSGWKESKLKRHMKECSVKYGTDAVEYELFRCWELTDEELDTYATIYTTKALSRKYNHNAKRFTEDKIFFNKVFKDYTQRKFWVNEPDATYESFLEFIDGLDTLFCKPVNLLQGRGAYKVKLDEWNPEDLYADFMSRPVLLVEECVKQHHLMNEIYSNSVNTVRLVTLVYKGEPRIISSFIRIGSNGSVVDNMVAGGMLAGVDEKTGIVVTGAVNNIGEVHDTHPNTGAQIVGFQIPNFDKACKIVIDALSIDPGLGYIGWDVAICEDKAVIIEANTLPGLASMQCAYSKEPYKKGLLYMFEEYL